MIDYNNYKLFYYLEERRNAWKNKEIVIEMIFPFFPIHGIPTVLYIQPSLYVSVTV